MKNCTFNYFRCNRDPCYDDPCGPNANCESRNDAAVCTCPPGMCYII